MVKLFESTKLHTHTGDIKLSDSHADCKPVITNDSEKCKPDYAF